MNSKFKQVTLLVISVTYLHFISFKIAAQTLTAPASPPSPSYDDFAYYKKNSKKPKGCENEVRQGFEAYDKQDCEKAIAFLKDAIKGGCDHALVLFKLAACSEFTGSNYSAAQYYKEAEEPLKILPAPHRYQKDFYESYGRVLLLNKKVDEALNYLGKASDLGSPSFTLFFLLGELYNLKKQASLAIEFYKRAITQPLEGASPSQMARAYGNIGKTFLEVKDWEKAIQYLDLALKSAPNDTELQQARYKAQELKRQNELFQMMQGLSGSGNSLPPFQPKMPQP